VDLRVSTPAVSKRHAMITRSQEGVYAVEDMGTKNGTAVRLLLFLMACIADNLDNPT
jgi:hypothetical protein